jgi:trans-2,3-dihydro-3-hydroxyanthranilate isomerase
MRTYKFATADVFTDRQFGGNPLAVILDAEGLTSEEMLAITREFNYSESTFVLPAERGGACRVRIFTPGGEVPFAGHPTVGTAHVLVALGTLGSLPEGTVTIVLEENVGDVPVKVRRAPGGDEPLFAQLSVAQLPEEREAPPVEALARVLGLDASDFVGGDWGPRAASCGLPFVIAPLKTRDAVSRARVNVDALAEVLPAGAWTRELMVVAMDGEQADARARVFVPMLNVPEDPATGSANAALAGYLAKRAPRLDGTLRWVVEQGVEMGRPSRLELEADKQGGEITGVRVGGSSVLVSTGELRLR